MSDLFHWAAESGDLAWPVSFATAWVAGELGHSWTNLPRISLYGLVGFALGNSQLGLLPAIDSGSVMLLANVAFGLILFELGYRVSLRWLRLNRWIAATSMLETSLTFVAVYATAAFFGMSPLTSVLLASLSMATSPAALVRVINEQRSSGQVTDRALHLTAANCVISVFAFKAIVGFWTFQNSGSVAQAMSSSLVLLAASSVLGAAFGVFVPLLLHKLGQFTQDATVVFAIGVVLLVAIAHTFRLSPVLAALTFGIVARHRRVWLAQAQRNFGALGDLLAVVLFVFSAATIDGSRVLAGFGLGLALIAARLAAKMTMTGALAHVSGTSLRKGVLTGMAMTPMSVVVILLLEQARFLGIDLIDQLAPLSAAALLLEVIGPVVTQRALMLAGEDFRPGPG
jgi:Kef-type K+ transport system membrane component KefB